MFHNLNYTVVFSTGRRLSGKENFQRGFGAITGPNESGKSMILELLRYSLFGTAALRAKGDTYKSINTECMFSIKNDSYVVKRTKTTATLSRNTKELTSGTSIVNQKIVELLGFGIDVFDISCSANQDKLNQLSDMSPVNRKRLVDSVVGLNTLDTISKWISDEIKTLKTSIDVSKQYCVKPSKPSKPDGYTCSTSLSLKREMIQDEVDKRNQYQYIINQPQMAEPQEPEKPQQLSEYTIEEIRSKAKQVYQLQEQIKTLESSIVNIEKPKYTSAQLDVLAEDSKLHDNHRWLESNPLPRYSSEELKKMSIDITHYDLMQRYKVLNKDTVICSECGTTVFLNDQVIGEIVSELLAMGLEIDEDLPTPIVTRSQYDQYCRQYGMYDWDTYNRYKDSPKPETAYISPASIDRMHQDLKHYKENQLLINRRKELQSELEQVEEFTHVEKCVDTYLFQKQNWKQKLDQYNNQRVVLVKTQTLLDNLQYDRQDLDDINNSISDSVMYETLNKQYKEDFKTYTQHKKELTQLEKTVVDYSNTKKAITSIRDKVKIHLMPSLSKASSVLIAKMTGGQRQKVDIDQHFNIEVDGQNIDTLSGSGKACTNLAIRIALGQVLTNNQFSVFLADEIDASMDQFRGAETAKTLRGLSSVVDQLLLVSHKRPEADYTIDLGDT